jgi:hypothetical protein
MLRATSVEVATTSTSGAMNERSRLLDASDDGGGQLAEPQPELLEEQATLPLALPLALALVDLLLEPVHHRLLGAPVAREQAPQQVARCRGVRQRNIPEQRRQRPRPVPLGEHGRDQLLPAIQLAPEPPGLPRVLESPQHQPRGLPPSRQTRAALVAALPDPPCLDAAR